MDGLQPPFSGALEVLMDLTIHVTEKHFQEFNKIVCADVSKMKGVKPLYVLTNVLFFMFVLISLLFYLESYKFINFSSNNGLLNALWGSSILFFSWLISSWRYKLNYLKACVTPAGTILGDMVISFDDDGVSEKGINHSLFYSWDSISKVIETKNLIIFLTDPVKGIIVPNDESSIKREEIIEYVKTKTNKDL